MSASHVDVASNRRRPDCLINCLFRRRLKNIKASNHCRWNPPANGFPSQKNSIAENVFIWWCHHDLQSNTTRISTEWQLKFLDFAQMLHLPGTKFSYHITHVSVDVQCVYFISRFPISHFIGNTARRQKLLYLLWLWCREWPCVLLKYMHIWVFGPISLVSSYTW